MNIPNNRIIARSPVNSDRTLHESLTTLAMIAHIIENRTTQLPVIRSINRIAPPILYCRDSINNGIPRSPMSRAHSYAHIMIGPTRTRPSMALEAATTETQNRVLHRTSLQPSRVTLY